MSRRRPSVLLALGLLVAALGPATAAPAADPEALDPASVPRELVVLTDGSGNYIAAARGSSTVLFGDDEVWYAQRVSSSSANSSEGRYSWGIWAANARGITSLDLADARWTIRCSDRETPLHVVDEKTTRALLGKVKLRKVKWKRQALAFARDKTGRYYYADRLRDEYGGRGVRLYVGKKGRLVEQKLVDVAFDSAGVVLETKKGSLTVDDKSASWTVGEKTKDLIFLPLYENSVVIYSELGVYREPLGVPCDVW